MSNNVYLRNLALRCPRWTISDGIVGHPYPCDRCGNTLINPPVPYTELLK